MIDMKKPEPTALDSNPGAARYLCRGVNGIFQLSGIPACVML